MLPLLLMLAALNVSAAPCQFERLEDFIEAYGRADPADPQIKNVMTVFEHVRQAADTQKHRRAQLAIVDLPDSPLAIALKNGIVLSRKAIQISYKNVTPAEGDARIAFIIGHELAHLANDDFWHKAFFCALEDDATLKKKLQTYQDSDGKTKEIAADDRGFIYAAIAGFAVDTLLSEKPNQIDFFTQWQQQFTYLVGKTHPDPTLRITLLQRRLREILEKIAFFKFGMRLAHFGRCQDGQYFLEAFSEVFPAAETFNNLGYCYLQSASKILSSFATLNTSNPTYCLPLMLDTVSQAESLSSPTTVRGSEDSKAYEFLQQAQHFLALAQQIDPNYFPAWFNAAIAALYTQDIYAARRAIEKAYQLAPDQLDIQGVRAVIIYQEGQSLDTWPQAMALLRTLANNSNATACVLFNAAQLMALRDRTEAKVFWQRLIKQGLDLPATLRKHVCQQQTCPAVSVQKPAKTWSLPVTLGTFLNPLPAVLKTSQKIPFDFVKEVYGAIYQNDDQAVLELAGFAEMVVLKNLAKDIVLADYCGQPLHKTLVKTGELWSCPQWSAWVVDQKVKEVWVTQ